MTLKEIKRWMKSARFIVTDYCEYDSDGNNYTRDIFEKDGKHYSVEYGNGEIMPVIRRGARGGLAKQSYYKLKEIKSTRDKRGKTAVEAAAPR